MAGNDAGLSNLVRIAIVDRHIMRRWERKQTYFVGADVSLGATGDVYSQEIRSRGCRPQVREFARRQFAFLSFRVSSQWLDPRAREGL